MSRGRVPPGTGWPIHELDPASKVVMPSPTAVQVETEKHDTSSRALTPVGSAWLVQVEPPSVVDTMASAPTAVQSVADTQDTLTSPVTPEGTGCAVQVSPPSDVTDSW